MAFRQIQFIYQGADPPESVQSGQVGQLIGLAFSRHPGLRNVAPNWYVRVLSRQGDVKAAILTVNWVGTVEPAWPALTSIYQVGAAQIGSRVTFGTEAPSTPTGTMPSTGPTGTTGTPPSTTGPIFEPPPLPGLPSQPTFRLPAINLGVKGVAESLGVQEASPWLWVALAALGAGVLWRASR